MSFFGLDLAADTTVLLQVLAITVLAGGAALLVLGRVRHGLVGSASRNSKPFLDVKDPSKRQLVTLVEKEALSHDVMRFRFALPKHDMPFGLPAGRHVRVFGALGEKERHSCRRKMSGCLAFWIASAGGGRCGGGDGRLEECWRLRAAAGVQVGTATPTPTHRRRRRPVALGRPPRCRCAIRPTAPAAPHHPPQLHPQARTRSTARRCQASGTARMTRRRTQRSSASTVPSQTPWDSST
jgi:hypothetical protein